MKHNSKLPYIGTTIFTVMSALANKHSAINLSQGFPDFNGDQKLIDLVSLAMNSGHNQYAPMAGSLELREAISKKFLSLYNTSYHPETVITVTAGATQAIFTAISAFIRPNDEVLVFRPAYDSYAPSVELNGGKAVSIQLNAPDYKVDWNQVGQHINSKTKMVIINTPQNPSGTVFAKDDMLRLQTFLKGTDILVLSDEVYEHIIFDGAKHQSACLFPDLRSRSFVVASFGKIFHNTGWKMGYCCAPKVLMEEFKKTHQYNVFCVNHPMQKALGDYLNEAEHYLGLPGFYQQKRDLFLGLIKDSKFRFTPAQGTYFQVLEYSKITEEPDLAFAKRMTIDHGLASIPMSVFNEGGLDQKVLRFCFAKTDDTLKKAADILNQV